MSDETRMWISYTVEQMKTAKGSRTRSMTDLYPEPPRPRMCPEPRCRPLYQYPGYSKKQLDAGYRNWQPGESWFCWGAMPGDVTFEYDGDVHTNDCRSCTFTPLKGLIAFQENRDDWWGMHRALGHAIVQLDLYREEK